MERVAHPDRPRPPERLRIFVALVLPADVVEAIVVWQRHALGDRPRTRAIASDALHVTLAFLGERDRDEVDRASAVVAATEPAAVPVRLAAEPIGLPRRRPRVIAFAAASPAAVALHEDLAARLAAAGLRLPERRPFRPHLSVARIRGDPGRESAERGALAGLPPLPARAGHTFDAVRMALYRSQLQSRGARYSALTDVDLPRDSGG